MLFMIFQYGLEPVLIHGILIGLEVILEMYLSYLRSTGITGMSIRYIIAAIALWQSRSSAAAGRIAASRTAEAAASRRTPGPPTVNFSVKAFTFHTVVDPFLTR